MSTANNPNPSPIQFSEFNTLYPTYYVQELLTHFARNGDSVVKATSDQSLLSVYAARRQDNSLTLLVINKDPVNTWTGNINLTGYPPVPTATVYSYGIAQDNAANPESKTYGFASQGYVESTLNNAATSFSASFAPYSANVVVLTPPVPVFTTQPMSQVLIEGSTLVMTATALGADSYQWYLNGVPVVDGTTAGYITSGDTIETMTITPISTTISGSTGPQLVISGATGPNMGDYTVVATNVWGTTTSNAATLGEGETSYPNPGAVLNMSGRALVGVGQQMMIGGFYISGTTARTVLIQAIGPSLTSEGIPSSEVLQNPRLVLKDSNGNTLCSNTGWDSEGTAESQVLSSAAAAVYAQPTLMAGSADSELLVTLPPGGYTAEISGADGGTGVALCAIYELP
jgi:hypothetical protein